MSQLKHRYERKRLALEAAIAELLGSEYSAASSADEGNKFLVFVDRISVIISIFLVFVDIIWATE